MNRSQDWENEDEVMVGSIKAMASLLVRRRSRCHAEGFYCEKENTKVYRPNEKGARVPLICNVREKIYVLVARGGRVHSHCASLFLFGEQNEKLNDRLHERSFICHIVHPHSWNCARFTTQARQK